MCQTEAMGLDEFVTECRLIVGRPGAHANVRTAMGKLLEQAEAIAAAHPQPVDADISGASETLFEDESVSIMIVHTPPDIAQPPHDHRMSVVIGGFRGTETQRLFRRSPHSTTPIEFHGTDTVGVRDVFSLGPTGVHAINAIGPEWAGAVHVYLGQLSTTERSLFHPHTLAEEPLELDVYNEYCLTS